MKTLLLVVLLGAGLGMAGVATTSAQAVDAGAVVAPVESDLLAPDIVEPAVEPVKEIDPVASGIEAASLIKAGKWFAAFAVVLSLIVWLLRTIGKKWIPWLSTRYGGYALAALAAASGVLLVAKAAGIGFSGPLLLDAGGAALAAWLAASGVHGAAKDAKAGDS